MLKLTDDTLKRLADTLMHRTVGMERQPYVILCVCVADALILPEKQRRTFLEHCDVI